MTTPAKRVVLVEDDEELAGLISEYLTEHGLRVDVIGDGAEAIAAVERISPDVVVLDQMLPNRDGLEICRELRPRFSGPILFLTARSGWVDEVVGLEVGADDYLGKPVQPRLLLARIRTVLRRYEAAGAEPAPRRDSAPRVVAEGRNLQVDARARSARLDGVALSLTDAEFDMLAYLVNNAGEPLSRERVARDVLGTQHDPLDRSIDVRVARLRAKLGDDPKHPRFIRSIRGVGYLFLPSQERP